MTDIPATATQECQVNATATTPIMRVEANASLWRRMEWRSYGARKTMAGREWLKGRGIGGLASLWGAGGGEGDVLGSCLRAGVIVGVLWVVGLGA